MYLNGRIFALSLAITLLATGCGSAAPSPSPANSASTSPAAGAATSASPPANRQSLQAEGKAVGYGVLVDSQWKALDEQFKKADGIPVENFRADTSRVMSRIDTEEQAGKHLYDFVVVESVYQDELGKKGYLQKLPQELMDRVPEKWRDPNGYWATFTLFPVTVIYNTDLVHKGDEPKTIDDLLDPKWKGKIAMTDPTLNEAFLRWFMLIRQQKGDKAQDFFTKLAAQNPTMFQSGLTVSTNVNQGQFPIGIGFMTHVLSVGGPNGHMAYMKQDPMPATNGAFALAAHPAHPQAARALADVFLSKAYLQQSGDLGYPITVPGVKSAIPGADSLNYEVLPSLPPGKFQEDSDYFKQVFKK